MSENNNRQRVSIPIRGLDTSSTDINAPDGAMKELHNLRYSGEAWRNVKPFTGLDFVQFDAGDDKIVYQHPADNDYAYIALRENGDGTQSLLRVVTGQYQVTQVINASVERGAKILHFGKMLIVAEPQSSRMTYYYLSDGKYEAFVRPTPPNTIRLPYAVTLGRTDAEASEEYSCAKELHSNGGDGKGGYFYKLVNVTSKSIAVPMVDAEYWWGEIAYLAVYEMEDGQHIAPSAIDIISAELDHCGGRTFPYIDEDREENSYYPHWGNNPTISRCILDKKHKYEGSEASDDEYVSLYNVDKASSNPALGWPFGTNTFRIRPKVRIIIDPNITASSPIKNVVLYATRINPIWDAQKVIDGFFHANGDNSKFGQYYADNDLLRQPLYKMDAIPIKDFVDGEYTYTITSTKLDGIEQKSAYEPVDSHSHYFEIAKEYNSRLHTAPITTLFEGFGESLLYSIERPEDTNYAGASIPVYGTTYHTLSLCYERLDNSNNRMKKVISYPDFRAIYLHSIQKEGNKFVEYDRYALEPSESNNIAYKITSDRGEFSSFFLEGEGSNNKCFQYVKYSNAHQSSDRVSETFTPSSKVTPSHILRVSAPSNPLVWPLANSYAIGSEENEIIAVNSAAIEMSDSKFGEFPLYAFTKEGIFALQSGTGEVLYGAIVPLNYDKIINPNTLAVNYNVLYITNRGVHALYSNEASLISEPINDSANRPLLDFLRTAQMAYQHKYGEVIIFNEDAKRYPHAYTFSLGSKVWATRDWHESGEVRRMLNNGKVISQDEYGSIFFYDINDENSPGKSSLRLVSRPIKFGTQEFKRLETMVARIQDDNNHPELHILLEASNDLDHWVTCREITTPAKNDLVIRRTPFSAKYFRLSLDCIAESDIAFMGFDFEYYLRFLHRMR